MGNEKFTSAADSSFESDVPAERADRQKGIELRTSSEYEPPKIVIIGRVYDLTTGSAASGNKDANSQYYW